jgi:hypothetical protein
MYFQTRYAPRIIKLKQFSRRECGWELIRTKPNEIGADRIERVGEWRQGRRASVLECGSPLPLSVCREKSARGLAQSKTSRCKRTNE